MQPEMYEDKPTPECSRIVIEEVWLHHTRKLTVLCITASQYNDAGKQSGRFTKRFRVPFHDKILDHTNIDRYLRWVSEEFKTRFKAWHLKHTGEEIK